MATPNSQMLRGAPLKCGIILGVSPSSDPTFDVEIVRATSSGVYSTVGRLTNLSGGIQPTFEDLLPYTTQTFSYKARAVKDGWLAGDYTSVVTAKPLQLPEIGPNITPLTGKALGANLYLSTGQSLAYGTPEVAQSYKKTVGFAANIFRAGSTAVSYSYGIGTLVPTTRNASTGANYKADLALPTGVTVYKAQWIYTRQTTAAVFRGELYSVSTAGTATAQWLKTSTAVSAGTKLVLTSSSFSFTVSNTYAVAQVALKSTGGGGNDASLVSLTLYYQTPAAQTAL